MPIWSTWDEISKNSMHISRCLMDIFTISSMRRRKELSSSKHLQNLFGQMDRNFLSRAFEAGVIENVDAPSFSQRPTEFLMVKQGRTIPALLAETPLHEICSLSSRSFPKDRLRVVSHFFRISVPITFRNPCGARIRHFSGIAPSEENTYSAIKSGSLSGREYIDQMREETHMNRLNSAEHTATALPDDVGPRSRYGSVGIRASGSPDVGNRSGAVVEVKTGRVDRNGCGIEVVDLPGTYSLTVYFADEIAAWDFILDEKPDIVVQVVDAANLEQSLYLTTQLAERGVPVVIVLNRPDTAEMWEDPINREGLPTLLDALVACMAGTQGDEPDDRFDAVSEGVETSPHHGRIEDYGEGEEATIASLVDALATAGALPGRYPLCRLAVELLEGGDNSPSEVRESPVFARVQILLSSLNQDDYEVLMTEGHYEGVATVLLQARGANAGVPGAADGVDDEHPRRFGCSGRCSETEKHGIVEYALTERGKQFAERLARIKELHRGPVSGLIGANGFEG